MKYIDQHSNHIIILLFTLFAIIWNPEFCFDNMRCYILFSFLTVPVFTRQLSFGTWNFILIYAPFYSFSFSQFLVFVF
ncbi:hypothetical protein QBC43DRAFT_318429 [Cladorrhinum sp. PSN259]|nr:hypothetical protein QBC43DRAFT_318429 [Cladorrhinum sp. PSN259]